MNKYKIFIVFVLMELMILLSFYGFSRLVIQKRGAEIESKKQLVRALKLTDLAIWTEARYTRHPSQADLFTPFQDSPASIEHFPAGSIIAPPEVIKGYKKGIEFRSGRGLTDGKT